MRGGLLSSFELKTPAPNPGAGVGGRHFSFIDLSRTHKQPNRIYDARGLHPALPSQETSGRYWILHQGSVRKLILAECYRIMGFPEEFKRASSASDSTARWATPSACPCSPPSWRRF